MGLVEDDYAVLAQSWIQNSFPEQHSVCQEFDLGLVRKLFVEADTVANELSNLVPHLLTNSQSQVDGRNTSWLCNPYQLAGHRPL